MTVEELREALRIGLITPKYVKESTGISGTNITKFKQDDERGMTKKRIERFNEQLKNDGFIVMKVKK